MDVTFQFLFPGPHRIHQGAWEYVYSHRVSKEYNWNAYLFWDGCMMISLVTFTLSSAWQVYKSLKGPGSRKGSPCWCKGSNSRDFIQLAFWNVIRRRCIGWLYSRWGRFRMYRNFVCSSFKKFIPSGCKSFLWNSLCGWATSVVVNFCQFILSGMILLR